MFISKKELNKIFQELDNVRKEISELKAENVELSKENDRSNEFISKVVKLNSLTYK